MKPPLRVIVQLARIRKKASGEPIEPVPTQTVPLASPQQGMPPSATHLAAKSVQPYQIRGDSVVVKVPAHHAIQPWTDDRDRLVPSLHQCCSDCCQSRAHAFLRSEANHSELALTARSAAVRESEKVEGFRAAFPSTLTINRGKSTKLDEPCLVEVQSQPEFRETLSAKRASGQPGSRRLIYADETRIRRHRKIHGAANPFDPQWRSYFVQRASRRRFVRISNPPS